MENKSASLLVVSLSKTLNAMLLSLCGRQVVGPSSLPVVVAPVSLKTLKPSVSSNAVWPIYTSSCIKLATNSSNDDDEEEEGMLYNFEIYCGRSANASLPSHLEVRGNLVVTLCQNLPHQQRYKVFFDNYFTSIPLLVELRESGILALGTIRQNRMVGAQKLF